MEVIVCLPFHQFPDVCKCVLIYIILLSDVVINAASVAVAIDQVLEQVELHQQQPIWCEVGN